MKNELEIINEAFKSYRFDSSYKRDEIYEVASEVYTNMEMIRIRHPEVYNEFVGKMIGKAAGAVVNAAGKVKDYIKKQPGEIVKGFKDKRAERLGSGAPAPNASGSKAPPPGEAPQGDEAKPRIENPPPSQKQNNVDVTKIARTQKTLQTVTNKGFQNPGAVSNFLKNPDFQEGFNKMSAMPGFKNLLQGRNPQLLKIAVAAYIAGTANRQDLRNRSMNNINMSGD